MSESATSLIVELHRTCRECGETKPSSLFVADKTHVRCKQCHAARRRAYRAAHPEKVREQKRESQRRNPDTTRRTRERHSTYFREYNRAYYRATWVSRALYNAKQRALANGLPFDITVEDIFLPEFCPVLGIRLEFGTGAKTGFHPASPSIDRIVPERGYVRGNIAVISMRANKLKSDATTSELERISAWMRSVGAK